MFAIIAVCRKNSKLYIYPLFPKLLLLQGSAHNGVNHHQNFSHSQKSPRVPIINSSEDQGPLAQPG